MEARRLPKVTNATLARVGEDYYGKILERVHNIAQNRTFTDGKSAGSLSVSVPSPGITAGRLRFNPVVAFSYNPLKDETLASMQASSENLALSGGMALYNVEQPGSNTLINDSSFNPSVVYGKGIERETVKGVRYSDWSYSNVKEETALHKNQRTATQFSGKIILLGEDFALWTPNGRWEDSKGRGLAAFPELTHIPRARVVAIPWIQTTTDVSFLIQPSFDFGISSDEETRGKMNELHGRIVEEVTNEYTLNTVNMVSIHITRHAYHKALNPGDARTNIFDDVFSSDIKIKRRARKLFEHDDLSLFGYTQSDSKALTTKTHFDLERFSTEDSEARVLDLEKRIYSSCTTPFVGKISSYLPRVSTDDLADAEAGMTLIVDPLILTLPSWIRPEDNGALTGINAKGTYVPIKNPSEANSNVVATSIRTKYLDLPNVQYQLVLKFNPQELAGTIPEEGVDLGAPLYYFISFPRATQAAVNELVLGDETLARVHLSSANVQEKVLGISRTSLEPLDTGIYNPAVSIRAKELLLNETQRILDENELVSVASYNKAENLALQTQPQGSILFMQALNSLIAHTAGSGLDLSMNEHALHSQEGGTAYVAESTIEYDGAKSFYMSLKLDNGSDVQSYLNDMTIRLELDTTIATADSTTLIKDARVFMEVLSALCATEFGISHTRVPNKIHIDGGNKIMSSVQVYDTATDQIIPITKGSMANMFHSDGRVDTTSDEVVALMAYLVQQTHENYMLASTFETHLSLETKLEWIARVRAWCDPATANTGGMSVYLSRYIEKGGAFARNVLFPLLVDYHDNKIYTRFQAWTLSSGRSANERNEPSRMALKFKYEFLDVVQNPGNQWTENVLPVRAQSKEFSVFLSSEPLTTLLDTEDPDQYGFFVKGDMSLNVFRALLSSSGVPVKQRLSTFPSFGGTGEGSRRNPYSTFTKYTNPFGFASLHGASSFMEGVSSERNDEKRLQRAFLFSDIGNSVSMVLDINVLSAFFVPVGQRNSTFQVINSGSVGEIDSLDSLADPVARNYRMTIAVDPTKEPSVTEAIEEIRSQITKRWKNLMKVNLSPTHRESRTAKDNWIATFFDDNGFSMMPNRGAADCFFFTVQQSLELAGEGTIPVKTLRKQVADQTTAVMFDTYLESFNAAEGTELEMEFRFMENVSTLAELRKTMLSCDFWANDQAILLMEQILNIKVIILDKGRHDEDPKKTIQCALKVNMPTFNPTRYMIVSLTGAGTGGAHYELVLYHDRGTFTYDQLPSAIKDTVMNACMGMNGAYDIVSAFSKEYTDLATTALEHILKGEDGLPIRVYTSLFVPAPLFNSHISARPEKESDAFAILNNQVSLYHKDKYTAGSLRVIEARGELRYFISFIPAIPLLRQGSDRVGITTNQAVRLMEMVNDPTHEAPSVFFSIVPEVLAERMGHMDILAFASTKENTLLKMNTLSSFGILSLERKVSRGRRATPTSHVSIYNSLDRTFRDSVQNEIFSESDGDDVVDMFSVWRQMHVGGRGSWKAAASGNVLGYRLDPMRRIKGRPVDVPDLPPGPPTRRAPVSPPRSPTRPPRVPTRPPRVPKKPAPTLPPRDPSPPPVDPFQDLPPLVKREEVHILSDAVTAEEVGDILDGIKEVIEQAEELVKSKNLGKETSLVQALDDLRSANGVVFKTLARDYVNEYQNYERVVGEKPPRAEIDAAARKVNQIWQPVADPMGRFAIGFEEVYENVVKLFSTLVDQLVIERLIPPAVPPKPRRPRVELDPNSLTRKEIEIRQLSGNNVRIQLNVMEKAMTRQAKVEHKNEMARILNSVTEGLTRTEHAYIVAREEYEGADVPTVEQIRNVHSTWTVAESRFMDRDQSINHGMNFLSTLRDVENIDYPKGFGDNEIRTDIFLIEGVEEGLKKLITEATEKGFVAIANDAEDLNTKFTRQLIANDWVNEVLAYLDVIEVFDAELMVVGTSEFSASRFEKMFHDVYDVWNSSFSNVLDQSMREHTENQRVLEVLQENFKEAKASADKEALEILEDAIQDLVPLADTLALDGEIDAEDTAVITAVVVTLDEALDSAETAIQELENEAVEADDAVVDLQAAVDVASEDVIDLDIRGEAQTQMDRLVTLMFKETGLSDKDTQRLAALRQIISWEDDDPGLQDFALDVANEIATKLGEAPENLKQNLATRPSPEASDLANIVGQVENAQGDADALAALEAQHDEAARVLRTSTMNASSKLENDRIRAERKAQKERHRAKRARKEAEAKQNALARDKKRASNAADTVSSSLSDLVASDSPLRALMDSFRKKTERLSLSPPTSPLVSPVSTPPMSPRVHVAIDDGDIVGESREEHMISSTTVTQNILMMPFMTNLFAPIISTKEQMQRVQFGAPRIVGYGNPALPLGLIIRVWASEELPFIHEADVIFPDVMPSGFNQDRRKGIQPTTLSSVSATFVGNMFQYSNTINLRNPVYRIVQSIPTMTHFPIKGSLDIVIGRHDPRNLDVNGIPERDDSPAARSYQFSLAYSFVQEGVPVTSLRPGMPIATMSELKGRKTTDAEGAPIVHLSPETIIAQVHLSGRVTSDFKYVDLMSFLVAFPSDSADALEFYKTL